MPTLTRRSITGLAAAAACAAAAAWWGAGAAAQEAPVRGAKGAETVTILDTSGKTQTITEPRLFSEEVGLLSVSLEPADEFTLKLGEATISFPVRSILEIQFSEAKEGEWTKVKVIDIEKRSVEGVPIATKVNEIRGLSAQSSFAKVKLQMHSVKKITFNWSSAARACSKDGCGRAFADPEWKFCPYHGRKLDDAKIK